MAEEAEEAGLKQTLDTLTAFARRRKWWIVVPLFIGTLAAIGVVRTLPRTYESAATLLVKQPQVSQRYVNPDAAPVMADALSVMTLEVLSRPRLSALIEELGLYRDKKNTTGQDALVAGMREDIHIGSLEKGAEGNISAFEIAYEAADPAIAQAVTQRLTDLFIEQNSKTRSALAEGTNDFLAQRLQLAKTRLAEQEGRLNGYKMQHLSELPEQQQTTLGVISDLRMQLVTHAATVARAEERKGNAEAAVQDVLSRLERERATLATRVTAQNPEMVKKNQEIASARALLTPGLGETAGPVPDPSLARVRTQISSANAEIDKASRDSEAVKDQLAQYQNKLSIAPVRQQQLTSYLRDYDAAAAEVRDLQSKQSDSQMTAKVEKDQMGLQFLLADAPSLPVLPTKPDRLKLSLAGAGGSLAVALLLAFLVDSRDTSFHSEKSVKEAFKLPIILSIPMLRTENEGKRYYRKQVLDWVLVAAMGMAVVAAELFVFVRG